MTEEEIFEYNRRTAAQHGITFRKVTDEGMYTETHFYDGLPVKTVKVLNRREKMVELLEKHITGMLSFMATAKDADGIEKLMRLYFEQLDKLEERGE